MRRFIFRLSVVLILLSVMSPIFSSPNSYADAYNPFSDACSNAPTGTSAPSACQADGTTNPVSGKDGMIFKAINIFSFIIGVASVIMIIFGSLKYVLAGGDSKNVGTAKSTITYAVIGIVVFLLSRGIIAFVINKL